jgi:hypothetical protein
MITLMNDGVFCDAQILEKETVELMSTNTRFSFFLWDYLRKLKRDGYGMGIEVCNHGLLGHGGSRARILNLDLAFLLTSCLFHSVM